MHANVWLWGLTATPTTWGLSARKRVRGLEVVGNALGLWGIRQRPPLPSSSNLRLLDPVLVREGSKFDHKLVIVILREPFVMCLQFNLANV